MKALSFRQPWAELILRGVKKIETRTWKSSFIGEFYIHAAKQIDLDCCKRFGIDPLSLATGAIVGRATIVSRVDYISEKQWRADEKMHCVAEPIGPKGRYGYVLTNVVRLKTPMPCNGKLNFFTVAGVGKSQAKSSKTI